MYSIVARVLVLKRLSTNHYSGWFQQVQRVQTHTIFGDDGWQDCLLIKISLNYTEKLGGSKQSHYDPFVNDKISVLLKIRLVNMAFLNPRRRSNAES